MAAPLALEGGASLALRVEARAGAEAGVDGGGEGHIGRERAQLVDVAPHEGVRVEPHDAAERRTQHIHLIEHVGVSPLAAKRVREVVPNDQARVGVPRNHRRKQRSVLLGHDDDNWVS